LSPSIAGLAREALDDNGRPSYMNGCNRLFIIIAACWAIVAPFLLMADANKPNEQAWVSCDQVVYGRYGSRNSVELNVVKYDAEVRRCIDVRNL
jgi:hypothetical protein